MLSGGPKVRAFREDGLSLLEFKAIQYKPRGNVLANDEQLARIAKFPKREFMRRGITAGWRWPNTKTFTVATNVKVYFCDPQSPWQHVQLAGD
jgi:hypothetical protein